MTNASVTISTTPPQQTASDYAALREIGLAYIERYAHAHWTDYNAHDPGITLLELLCYAITDLSLRTSLDMKDLLASSFQSVEKMQQSFLTAGVVLPTGPVSELDYRKLLIDLEGVRNAWLEPGNETVFVNYRAKTGEQRLGYQPFPGVPGRNQTSFTLKGSYGIQIDYDPAYIQQQLANKKVATEKQCREEITQNVRKTYWANRNLCEDLVDVKPVPLQYILFCADIGIENGAKVNEVYAEILFRVQEYLAPPVKRYSLAEMQARTDANGNPLTIDQIFDGPRLKNGFIDDGELEKSQLRTQVYASDLINIMMGVKGVRDVKKVVMNAFKPEKTEAGDIPDTSGNKLTLRTDGGQRWRLPIDPGHQPQLFAKRVALSFFKDIIPVGNASDPDRALEQLAEMQEKAYRENRKTVVDLPVPVGEVYDLKTYSSIANDLPQNYGVGRFGLPASASPERKAQASQLKAYLVFFDQILANYLAQLANLKSFFSADTTLQTYFGQAVSDLAGVKALYVNHVDLEKNIDSVLAQLEGYQDDPARKHRFLDHLLARFAENFNEYALLMHSFYGERGTREILEDKVNFIAEYGKIDRSKGFNYSEAAWQTDNVAGITLRLARLIGMRNTDYQAYKASAVWQASVEMETNESNTARYRFVLDSAALNQRVLISTNLYETKKEAEDAIRRNFWPVPAKGRFVIGSASEQFTYTLYDTDQKPVASSPKPLSSEVNAQAAVDEIVKTSGEALFLVEHALLLPKNDGSDVPKAWMKVGIESDGEYCEPLDPYSYRVSVILPGYTTRFRDLDYRSYVEKIIRSELPAHVLARICWVSRDQLSKFETAYREWLEARAAAGVLATGPVLPDALHEKANALIHVLEHPDFHTIYETGVLHDPENPNENNPITLNRTVLGD